VAKFRVPITRDVTVTTHIIVNAKSAGHAVEVAERYAQLSPEKLNWELDDCTGGMPYFAGDDDLDTVEEVTDD
jgi:hypothetical protein